MNRSINILFLMLLTITLPGCELVGDIFKIGFVGGIIVVLLVIALFGWLLRRLF
jgi:hypothetical protein